MVEIIVIPDGAAEDPRTGPTSLERAVTPVLDELCRAGEVRSLQTIPSGLPSGSEVGIPTLLGVEPRGAPSRGLIEAAAAGIAVRPGACAWRVDLPRHLADRADLARDGERHGLIHLRGHRWLGVGREAPRVPAPWRVWSDGDALPRVLDGSTAVVCGPGAAAGCAVLLGARVVIPEGATGDVDTDYGAKARAALGALEDARRVVVHVGAPDEASHRCDRPGKIAALEALDALILAPLVEAVRGSGALLTVCPDHGTDPESGEHLDDPVPALRWGAGVAAAGPDQFTERAVLEGAAP